MEKTDTWKIVIGTISIIAIFVALWFFYVGCCETRETAEWAGHIKFEPLPPPPQAHNSPPAPPPLAGGTANLNFEESTPRGSGPIGGGGSGGGGGGGGGGYSR